MQITDRMAYSLTFPLATELAFRIIAPPEDGLLERIRKSQENKPISLFETLNIEQVKELRKILDWAIERMELDTAKKLAMGSPGCMEDNWPKGEYTKRDKEIAAINAKYGMGIDGPTRPANIEETVSFETMSQLLKKDARARH